MAHHRRFLERRSAVRYTTKDASAKAGERYVKTTGKLVFEPGVNELSIDVPMIENDTWEGTVEFGVELEKEGLVNADLGRYLWHTRVKINSMLQL